MTPREYLGKLPKYKKTWVKERTNQGYSENLKEVYLVAEHYDPIRHHGEVKTYRLTQWPERLYPCKDIYFFELFKYLRKYQLQELAEEQPVLRFTTVRMNKQDLKKCIKQHLLSKHGKQLSERKLSLLPEYSQLIEYCFNELLKYRGSKISLVIQKKIGYKYYENITYT